MRIQAVVRQIAVIALATGAVIAQGVSHPKIAGTCADSIHIGESQEDVVKCLGLPIKGWPQQMNRSLYEWQSGLQVLFSIPSDGSVVTSIKIPSAVSGAQQVSSAQKVLTNQAIVKMVKSGLGENVIISMVQTQPGEYSLTSDDVVKLNQAGVSEKILTAMVTKGSGTAGNSPGASAPASDPDIPQGIDIGVYFKKAQWEEMLPEIVNWKTGGVIKHIATVGVVRFDVNGHMQGAHSRSSCKSPIEALIYTPEGVAITEYQLIHLHEHNDNREFRTVTGGVLHEAGGATRDVIPFEGKKVASRMYKVLLPSLGAGEYGFLPPGAFGSASSASIGKMYTFRLVE